MNNFNHIPDFDSELFQEKPGIGTRILKGIALVVVILLAAAAVTASVLYTRYVSVENGVWVIDLSGEENITQEDILRLSGLFPDAEIRHTIDLDGLRVANTETGLTLTDGQGISPDTLIGAAEQLSDISFLDLTGMTISAGQYEQLCEAYPDARITWLVPLSIGRTATDVTGLQLDSMAALHEVLELRTYLPELRSIDMTGAVLTDTELKELWENRDSYGVNVKWTVTVAGQQYAADTVSLELTGSYITDLTELYRLPMLSELTLDGIGTGDLSPLVSIKTLESITLRNMDVDDVSVLARMDWLGSFFVKNTNVTRAQLESLQEELPECIIMRIVE